MRLNVKRVVQTPNECEPACLKQVLDFFGIRSSLDELVKKISCDVYKWHNWDFNTARTALDYGLNSVIFTRTIGIFDPTWFNSSNEKLLEKLKVEREYFEKSTYVGLPSFKDDVSAAIRFLERGGRIEFVPISSQLISQLINQKKPVIAGISYPLLLNKKREYFREKDEKWVADDVKGHGYGHVINICGYSRDSFYIIDPYPSSPGEYEVRKDVLIESVLRNDSNIIAFGPKFSKDKRV